MKTSHLKKLALVFVAQVICLGCVGLWENTKLNWLSSIFLLCTFIVPLAGYVAVLYKAPTFEKMSSIPKMVCLGAFSFFATLGGLMFSGIVIIVVETLAGIPMRQ